MSKTFTIIFLLTVSIHSNAQMVDFFMASSYPASPLAGVSEVAHLFETQMIYPKEQLQLKRGEEVFVVLHVSWDGKIDTIFSNLEKGNIFAKEAIRLASLIVWKKDKIREGKKIENQQIKVIFDPKKYKKIVKKRKVSPLISDDQQIYIARQLSIAPKVKDYKSVSDYVRENIKYPALALQQVISGSVSVSFVIEKNGVVSNCNITKPLAGGCNEETIRLLKNVTWEPGMKDGKPVRTQSQYNLTFVHPGNSYR